jgi:hypothetical protein
VSKISIDVAAGQVSAPFIVNQKAFANGCVAIWCGADNIKGTYTVEVTNDDPAIAPVDWRPHSFLIDQQSSVIGAQLAQITAVRVNCTKLSRGKITLLVTAGTLDLSRRPQPQTDIGLAALATAQSLRDPDKARSLLAALRTRSIFRIRGDR